MISMLDISKRACCEKSSGVFCDAEEEVMNPVHDAFLRVSDENRESGQECEFAT